MGSRATVRAVLRWSSVAAAAGLASVASAQMTLPGTPQSTAPPGTDATPQGPLTRIGYLVTAGVGESDNINLLPSGGKAETITEQGVDFTWHETRPLFDVNMDGDLNYLEYLQHTYSNEVVGNFLGQAQVTLVPEFLTWSAADNFGQGRVDPLTAVTPNNRENINYLTTGPELLLPLGPLMLLDATATYGKVSYQVTPLDSQRFGGGLGLIRKLDPTSSVSLNVRDTHADFSNDELNPDFQRQDAFLRYDLTTKRTVLGIDLGYSKLRDAQSPGQGLLARFEASRHLSASSAVTVTFGQQFSDAADAFKLGQTLGGANLNTSSVTQTATPFMSQYETIAWNFQRARTAFGIGVEHYKDAYTQPSNLDDNRTQLDAHFSRRLTPTLEGALSGQYFRQQFNTLVGNSNETIADAQLTWHAGRRLSFVFDVDRWTRRSNSPGTNFSEDRVWLRLSYGRPAPPLRGPAVPPLPIQVNR